jgi:hypothetical protein
LPHDDFVNLSLEIRSITSSIEHRVFLSCLCICLVCILLPIWCAGILPFTDYPVHLALIQAVDLSGKTPAVLADRYETNWFSPYSGAYLLARLITWFFSVETTGRILLTLYLLATPLFFFRFMHTFGKPAYLAFPIFVLVYNFNLSWGFLPFLTGIPLMIESLTQTLLFQEKPSRKRGLCLGIVFVLLFFTHIFAFLIGSGLLVCASVFSLVSGKKTGGTALVPLVPAALLAFIWRSTLVLTDADAYFLDKGIRFAPLGLKFRFFADYCISGYPGGISHLIFACLVILILLRFLPVPAGRITRNGRGYIQSQNPGKTHPPVNRYGLLFVTAIWLIYLACPYSWLTAVWLFNRTAFLAMAFTLLLLPRFSRFPPVFFMLGSTVLCLWLSFYSVRCYISFSDEARKGRDIIQLIPPEKSLRYIAFNPRSSFADHAPYSHFGQYYSIDRNGFVHNPFAVLTHVPIRYRAEYRAVESGFRPEIFRNGTDIKVDTAFDRTDYFLVRMSPAESPENTARFLSPGPSHLLEPVHHQKEWVLLKKPGDRQ